MRIKLKSQYLRGKLCYSTTIRLVAFYFVITQILTVFRATSIFNSSYTSNYLRLFISSVFIISFVYTSSGKSKGFTYVELVLLLIPIAGLGIGLSNFQFGRDYFSDYFNATAFVLIIVHYRRNPEHITKEDLEYLAKYEFLGTLISLLTYEIFPLIGYPIGSVGKVSNFLLFPLAYYLSYKNKWWIAVFITILFGGKRGVMISAIVLLCFYYVFNKIGSIKGIIAIIFAGSLLSAMLFFTESPEHIALLPTSLQRVGLKFMRVNPFSKYIDLHSDGRLDEIEGALRSFDLTPINVLFGKGNGFVYNTFHDGTLTLENNHNIHFTPISLLTRYGIIYTAAFYFNYLWILFKSTIIIRHTKEHQFMMSITLFLAGTFVDMFTTFLIYTDYQFIICFGLLNGILFYNYVY